jgi:hypothetical protein
LKLVLPLAAFPCNVTHRPAVAENRAQHISTFFEQVGDILHCVLHPLAIIFPTGMKYVISDYLIVDAAFVQAERGHVQPRRFDGGQDEYLP